MIRVHLSSFPFRYVMRLFVFFTACGGYIELGDSDPPGFITSPNYPSNYPQNIDCIWVISVPNGEAVQLDFDEDFYIEPNTKYGRTKKIARNLYLVPVANVQ